MKKLRRKRIHKKIAEGMEKSKTRKKIAELSYNCAVLPFKMRFALDTIRKDLGFHRKISMADIKTIDKAHRWYKKNEREQ